MSYCDGNCKYLDKNKHKCTLTGEKLTYMKQSRPIAFEVHEHNSFCEEVCRDWRLRNDRAGSSRNYR